jgi:hypothetical protein
MGVLYRGTGCVIALPANGPGDLAFVSALQFGIEDELAAPAQVLDLKTGVAISVLKQILPTGLVGNVESGPMEPAPLREDWYLNLPAEFHCAIACFTSTFFQDSWCSPLFKVVEAEAPTRQAHRRLHRCR